MKHLDENYPLYTPGVRRLYTFEFHHDQHLLATEVRRTLDELARSAKVRIERGQITEGEAKTQAALWLAIAEDLEAQDRWLREGAGASGWSLATKLRELRVASGVAWERKVTEIRREVERRRNTYPGQVDVGMITRDQAKTQLERLEATHDLYWRHCYAFDGTREELSRLADCVQSASVAQFGQAPVPSVWNERGRVDQPKDQAA